MVSVFDDLARLPPARTLLTSLRPKGCTITADALHCRAGTATVIREAAADYVLGVETNQPTLSASAEAAFQGPR